MAAAATAPDARAAKAQGQSARLLLLAGAVPRGCACRAGEQRQRRARQFVWGGAVMEAINGWTIYAMNDEPEYYVAATAAEAVAAMGHDLGQTEAEMRAEG